MDEEEYAFRIHSYNYDYDSDSNSDKSDFDEFYFNNKPPPFNIDGNYNIVKISKSLCKTDEDLEKQIKLIRNNSKNTNVPLFKSDNLETNKKKLQQNENLKTELQKQAQILKYLKGIQNDGKNWFIRNRRGRKLTSCGELNILNDLYAAKPKKKKATGTTKQQKPVKQFTLSSCAWPALGEVRISKTNPSNGLVQKEKSTVIKDISKPALAKDKLNDNSKLKCLTELPKKTDNVDKIKPNEKEKDKQLKPGDQKICTLAYSHVIKIAPEKVQPTTTESSSKNNNRSVKAQQKSSQGNKTKLSCNTIKTKTKSKAKPSSKSKKLKPANQKTQTKNTTKSQIQYFPNVNLNKIQIKETESPLINLKHNISKEKLQQPKSKKEDATKSPSCHAPKPQINTQLQSEKKKKLVLDSTKNKNGTTIINNNKLNSTNSCLSFKENPPTKELKKSKSIKSNAEKREILIDKIEVKDNIGSTSKSKNSTPGTKEKTVLKQDLQKLNCEQKEQGSKTAEPLDNSNKTDESVKIKKVDGQQNSPSTNKNQLTKNTVSRSMPTIPTLAVLEKPKKRNKKKKVKNPELSSNLNLKSQEILPELANETNISHSICTHPDSLTVKIDKNSLVDEQQGITSTDIPASQVSCCTSSEEITIKKSKRRSRKKKNNSNFKSCSLLDLQLNDNIGTLEEEECPYYNAKYKIDQTLLERTKAMLAFNGLPPRLNSTVHPDIFGINAILRRELFSKFHLSSDGFPYFYNGSENDKLK